MVVYSQPIRDSGVRPDTSCIQLLRRTSVILFIAGSALLARTGEIRIGVDQAAPYQSWREGYGPVGFTVDVLENAARKRGIALKWINCPEGPTKAFAAGKKICGRYWEWKWRTD